jgi:hypothetical protein
MGLRKKKSLIDQASGTVSQYVDQVKPQLESAMSTAKEKTGPVLADAKAKAAPVLADAKAKAGPAVASGAAIAAEKIAAGATIAAEKAAEASQAAADRVAEVAAPQPKKKRGTLKKLLLVTGLAAAAAYVAQRLRGPGQGDSWQSSYTPTPAPNPGTVGSTGSTGPTHDEGGSSPDEAIADSAETPHPVTTPDEPADVVDVDKEK